jgi:hypothetical protein
MNMRGVPGGGCRTTYTDPIRATPFTRMVSESAQRSAGTLSLPARSRPSPA